MKISLIDILILAVAVLVVLGIAIFILRKKHEREEKEEKEEKRKKGKKKGKGGKKGKPKSKLVIQYNGDTDTLEKLAKAIKKLLKGKRRDGDEDEDEDDDEDDDEDEKKGFNVTAILIPVLVIGIVVAVFLFAPGLLDRIIPPHLFWVRIIFMIFGSVGVGLLIISGGEDTNAPPSQKWKTVFLMSPVIPIWTWLWFPKLISFSAPSPGKDITLIPITAPVIGTSSWSLIVVFVFFFVLMAILILPLIWPWSWGEKKKDNILKTFLWSLGMIVASWLIVPNLVSSVVDFFKRATGL